MYFSLSLQSVLIKAERVLLEKLLHERHSAPTRTRMRGTVVEKIRLIIDWRS